MAHPGATRPLAEVSSRGPDRRSAARIHPSSSGRDTSDREFCVRDDVSNRQLNVCRATASPSELPATASTGWCAPCETRTRAAAAAIVNTMGLAVGGRRRHERRGGERDGRMAGREGLTLDRCVVSQDGGLDVERSRNWSRLLDTDLQRFLHGKRQRGCGGQPISAGQQRQQGRRRQHPRRSRLLHDTQGYWFVSMMIEHREDAAIRGGVPICHDRGHRDHEQPGCAHARIAPTAHPSTPVEPCG